jgi:hypothetical protein
MAIDLLGKEPPKKTGKTLAKVILHQPFKEKEPAKVGPLPKVESPKPELVAPAEELGEVNLITSFKAYLLKKRVAVILICLLVIVVIGSVIFYLVTRPPKIVINTNLNQPINNNTNQLPPPAICGNGQIELGEQCDQTGCDIDQTCVNCQCQAIIPPQSVCGNGTIETGEQCDLSACGSNQTCTDCLCQTIITPPPVCGNGQIETGEQCDLLGCGSEQTCLNCQCQTVILPDTELTLLRGAIVKFSDSSEVYLVEWHGELRLINQQTVVFKAGQTISSLAAQNQIYLINSNYKGIRQGKEVSGYVAWDPRILSAEELKSFK